MGMRTLTCNGSGNVGRVACRAPRVALFRATANRPLTNQLPCATAGWVEVASITKAQTKRRSSAGLRVDSDPKSTSGVGLLNIGRQPDLPLAASPDKIISPFHGTRIRPACLFDSAKFPSWLYRETAWSAFQCSANRNGSGICSCYDHSLASSNVAQFTLFAH